MRLIFTLLIILTCFLSCRSNQTNKSRQINSVEVKAIFEDSLLSIRSIEILDDGNLAFAANNGAFGLFDTKAQIWKTSKQTFDSLNLQFRSVSHTSSDFFMMSIENPALLYKTGDNGHMQLVYKEENEKVFYDAMRFWNDREGIAIGDPTGDCMSIVITRDSGNTWAKLPCDKLPKAKEGEAAFAASNTNIAIVGDHTWVATGGKTSRVLYSPDNGKFWEAFDTPIVQGLETTGIFSIDFYDELNGFAIGGDYTKPEENGNNKIITKDGGKTWQLIGKNQNPGYRSCVQYIPKRGGKDLVATGFKGIDFSNDGGYSWKHLSDEGFYTIRILNDSVAYAAGAGRICKLTFKE